jgi:hypothetical protein
MEDPWRVGCAVFATFFIHFQANLSRYEYYTLHIYMFRYIRKHHLFASFAHIYFKIFTRISMQIFDLMQKKYMLKQIFASERRFDSYFLILANICFKRFVLKQIYAKLQANFIFKQIFACKYLHTSKYSHANICTPADFC